LPLLGAHAAAMALEKISVAMRRRCGEPDGDRG
jgi:hypothetical protein